MARSSTARARRSLLQLTALVVLVVAGLAAAVQFSTATWTPRLALDLAGGTQIVLTPQLRDGEEGTITDQTITDAITIIRQRVDASGSSEAEVTSEGGRNIVVNLPGDPASQVEARRTVAQAAQMRFRPVLTEAAGTTTPAPTGTPTATPTDGATAPATTAPAADPSASTAAPADGASIAPAPGTTATATGTSQTPAPAATTSAQGARLPSALLAAPTTAAPAATAATPPAASTATTPAASPSPTDPSDLSQVTPELYSQFTGLSCANPVEVGTNLDDDPARAVATCSSDGSTKYLLGPVEVEGTDIAGATAGLVTTSTGATTNQWSVNLSLDSRGTQQFADSSTRLFALQAPQNQFAIVLDGTVVSAPAIQSPITDGNAQITGSFTQETATTLANQLKFGALPISFAVQTEQQISAVLGSEQLQRGLLAGAIGLLLVVVYSLLQYRALGLVTVGSLVVAGGLAYVVTDLLSWGQGYRLSLAGVAGFIVSIGITADSFIVFFERVRDEVREGRSLTSAVETGWARARRTIIISDVVNFLAAAVLYVLAVGGVRGFAFTLGLTTLIDLLVVVLFTHPVVVLLARRRFFADGHRLSGFDAEHLGRPTAYRGRGRFRTPAPAGAAGAAVAGPAGATAADADREPVPEREPATVGGPRLTIAERRAQREAAARDGGTTEGSTTTTTTTTTTATTRPLDEER